MRLKQALAALGRRKRSVAGKPREPEAPLTVESRHLSESVAAAVEDWFAGRTAELELSGLRSVVVAHPDDPERRLKIKGAGYKGRRIGFGVPHRSGLTAPRFDFEGRMMLDVAAGHDTAHRGGATFQQAAVEYEVTQRLAAAGYPVVPCLGYGRVSGPRGQSWFSVFEWDSSWRSVHVPDFTMARYAETARRYGSDLLDIATRHDLVGYFWYAGSPDGELRIKDLHPFQRLDPVSHSAVSWTMHVFYALHIFALPALLMPPLRDAPDKPADLQVHTFKAVLPDVTVGEHEALRMELVAPYMRREPEGFEARRLVEILQSHRLTRAIMERCPPRYARP
jgi:hypothetical protein